jgi:beta-fructofuranosidase
MQKPTGRFILCVLLLTFSLPAQSQKLTPENINKALQEVADVINQDTLRPAFHLTPPAGCMGDPNGGIYYDGWYHIFYGLHPFAGHPGGWYWAHAKTQDFLNWQHFEPGLTPAFDLGLNHVGSGSTILDSSGNPHAFYSASTDDDMKFWQTHLREDLNAWEHPEQNPILTLDHPGLPDFDGFWRDPFVFSVGDRTFLIACADLLEEDYVPVPLFEAKNQALSQWEYKGILFEYPKHKFRNFEVPEFRPLQDKWIFLASSDAPVDRCIYFTGEFDLERLRFIPENSGIVDYSGHYYAQETIQDNKGDLFLMAWMPGWDRDWLPTYMNQPLKNDGEFWNGCFAIPRQLSLDRNGKLIQIPVTSMKALRGTKYELSARDLPVSGPMTEHQVLTGIRGDQLELQVELALGAASFCGLNLLCNAQGVGGLPIIWTGDQLNMDGVRIPLPDWNPGQSLHMQIFIDRQFVEVFLNQGQQCVSRRVPAQHIKGDHISLTSLGGTARLVLFQAWELAEINNN